MNDRKVDGGLVFAWSKCDFGSEKSVNNIDGVPDCRPETFRYLTDALLWEEKWTEKAKEVGFDTITGKEPGVIHRFRSTKRVPRAEDDAYLDVAQQLLADYQLATQKYNNSIRDHLTERQGVMAEIFG